MRPLAYRVRGSPAPTARERPDATLRPMRRTTLACAWTLTAAAFALAGCGGPPPCGAARGCPEGAVCQLDGTCRPLSSGPGARFARTRRLRALDWAVLREGGLRPPRPALRGDELALGGPEDARVVLAFGPIPDDRPIGRVVLTLHPHPGWSGPRAAGRVAVAPAAPFDGAALERGEVPAVEARPRVERGVAATAGRPLRLDVTELVHRTERRAHLGVTLARGGGPAPWRLASPRATDPNRRPHLDLLLR